MPLADVDVPAGARAIPLTRGLVALVDEQDEAWARRYRWVAYPGHGTYYAMRNDQTTGKKTTVRMHREMLNARPDQLVDHENGDGLDNRRANLRFCTNRQNAANGRKRSSTKRVKGVYRLNKSTSWHALIVVDRRRHYLGAFVVEEDAARAYDVAARCLCGEFARTNEAMGMFNAQEAGG